MNFVEMCRTNYFLVKDRQRFLDYMEQFEDMSLHWDGGGTKCMMRSEEEGGIPGYKYDEASGEYIDVDFPGDLREHLAEGEVALFYVIGYEGMRALTGHALAVAPGKPIVCVSLDDIREKASEVFGIPQDRITQAYN